MKSAKDTLVSEYLERVGGDVLASEHFRAIVRGMIKGHAGVYALYKNESLYYVGLAFNLMGRVNHHLRDWCAGWWVWLTGSYCGFKLRKIVHATA